MDVLLWCLILVIQFTSRVSKYFAKRARFGQLKMRQDQLIRLHSSPLLGHAIQMDYSIIFLIGLNRMNRIFCFCFVLSKLQKMPQPT